jgi:hypothetical protein
MPVSDHEIVFPPILAMRQASSLADAGEVAAWRGPAPSADIPAPAGQLFLLQPLTGDELPPDAIEPVILRRGSARRFAIEPITFEQLDGAALFSARSLRTSSTAGRGTQYSLSDRERR